MLCFDVPRNFRVNTGQNDIFVTLHNLKDKRQKQTRPLYQHRGCALHVRAEQGGSVYDGNDNNKVDAKGDST